MAHRHRCSCSCHYQRKMDRPAAPIVQNNYYNFFVSPQQVLVGPNQLPPQIIAVSRPVAKIPALPSSVRASVPAKHKLHPGCHRYAIKNDKLGDKHREPRPITNDKHLRCGVNNARSGEKHKDGRQTAGGAANDKKVREIHHHHVKGEPKKKVNDVDAKPRVKCANGGTHHKY